MATNDTANVLSESLLNLLQDENGKKEANPEVLRLLVCHRFQDDLKEKGFGSLWFNLQQCGWVFVSQDATYHYNNDELVLQNAKEVVKYLDQGSVAPVYNHLQHREQSNDQHQQQLFHKARLDMVRCIIEKRKKTKMPAEEAKHQSTEDNNEPNETSGREKKSPRRPKRQSSNTDQSSSSIKFDQGADMNLQNKKPKKRRNAAKKQAEENDGVGSAKRLSLQHVAEMFEQQAENLTPDYTRPHHSMWKFLLSTNHSLLFYGVGSKRNLLNIFCDKRLEEYGDTLTVDAFDTECTVDGILSLIRDTFLGGTEPEFDINHSVQFRLGVFPNYGQHDPLTKRAAAIGQALGKVHSERRSPLYIIVHSIEDLGTDSQALAALVVHSAIDRHITTVRLVASIDDCTEAQFLWSRQTSANFSWMWLNINTDEPFLEEMKRGLIQEASSVKRVGTKKHTMEGNEFANVLRTLSPRHAQLLKELAEHQYQKLSSGSADLLAAKTQWKQLFELCRNKLLTTHEAHFRTQIHELIDHGLIKKSQKDNDVWIPMGMKELQAIMAFGDGT